MGNINLGTLTFLTLRADVNTPAIYTQYDGLRLTVPQSVTLPPQGEYSTLQASGVTVYGYIRTAPDGSLEWLMTPQQDPVVAQIDTLVAGGWTDQPARTGYANQAKYLLGQGITSAVLWPGLKSFYDWAKADLVAKGWKPPA